MIEHNLKVGDTYTANGFPNATIVTITERSVVYLCNPKDGEYIVPIEHFIEYYYKPKKVTMYQYAYKENEDFHLTNSLYNNKQEFMNDYVFSNDNVKIVKEIPIEVEL